jgi:superfamily I DNA/RNA helicase
MRWYIPFDKLSQKQLEVLNGISAQIQYTHWIQGFAGTGKTLIITHLMERVATLNPTSSICFVTFTNALTNLVASGVHSEVAKRVDIKTHTQFLSQGRRYDYVFLDEVQDISVTHLVAIKSLSNNLYIAGDGDQRIYDRGASEKEITAALSPRTWKLFEIFRLTELLKQVAQSIHPRTKLIEGLLAKKQEEVTIRLAQHDSSLEESSWTWEEAKKLSRPGDPSVILFPTHRAVAHFANEISDSIGVGRPPARTDKGDYTFFNEYWENAGMNFAYFGNGYGELTRSDMAPFVYLMTFHSSKGLDFQNVFIPGLNQNSTIVSKRALENDPELDRRLLFVAVTRSRKNLFMSHSGQTPHALLKNLPASVIARVDPRKSNRRDDEEEFF